MILTIMIKPYLNRYARSIRLDTRLWNRNSQFIRLDARLWLVAGQFGRDEASSNADGYVAIASRSLLPAEGLAREVLLVIIPVGCRCKFLLGREAGDGACGCDCRLYVSRSQPIICLECGIGVGTASVLVPGLETVPPTESSLVLCGVPLSHLPDTHALIPQPRPGTPTQGGDGVAVGGRVGEAALSAIAELPPGQLVGGEAGHRASVTRAVRGGEGCMSWCHAARPRTHDTVDVGGGALR